MSTEGLSRSEKLRGLYRVMQFKPYLITFLILFGVFAALLEGFGISFIMPIIEVAQSSADPTAEADGYMGVFVSLYDFLGVPFTLEYLIAGVILVLAARYTSSFIVGWLRYVLQSYYTAHLQTQAFDEALDARIAYFDEEGSDDILNAIVTQANYAGKVVKDIATLFNTLLMSIMYLAIAFYLSWQLTMFAIVLLGGTTLLFRYLFESGYSLGDRIAETNERIQESAQAGTQGIRDAKLFTLRDELFDSFLTQIERRVDAEIRLTRNEQAISQFYNLVVAAMLFVLVYVALVFTGLSFGALGVFLFAMFQLGPKVSALNSQFYKIEGQFPHLIRTQNFIENLERNQEPESGDRPVPNDPTPIRFENVSFAYGDEKILHDISFEIHENEFVAFVGQSGAGKSTIAALLARMYEVDSGRITASGEPIDEFDIDEWRERVAMVRQDPFIFNDTLRRNVTIANRDATDHEIKRACEIAHVTEFMDQLPDGLDSELGDDGVRLSGGQRQRVALARALLKDADVLILDEATSDLDTGIEQQVQYAIEAMERDYAILAIAHRLSTVRGTDRIYTMEDGRISEQGEHHELLEEDGKYAELYASQ